MYGHCTISCNKIVYYLIEEAGNRPLLKLMEMALTSASSASSVGGFLVDLNHLIPILKFVPKFVPGATFQKKAWIGRKLQEEFRERPYVASIESMVSH